MLSIHIRLSIINKAAIYSNVHRNAYNKKVQFAAKTE